MMKKLFVFTLVLLLCGFSHAQVSSKQKSDVKIIAKGGYFKSSETPANSIDAMMAAQRFGCYASTCEVTMTSDDYLVVCEELSFRKKIGKDTSLEMLKNTGVKVTMLDEFLLRYKKFFIQKENGKAGKELKPVRTLMKNPMKLMLLLPTTVSAKQQKVLLSMLGKSLADPEIRKQVEFCSSDLEQCYALALVFPDVPVTCLKYAMSPREIRKHEGDFRLAYSCKILRENPKWMKDAVAMNMSVAVLNANSKSEVEEMMKLGVATFITENVALVSAWAEKKPLVKLMSFNIRMSGMPDVDGDNAWPNRKEAVVKMIAMENPDVMGVQEMLPDQQKYLRKELRDYSMVGVGRDDGRSEGECMGIFYKKNRFSLLDSGTFWLSQTPEIASLGWDAACKRTVTYVQLKDNQSGKTFYYFNTHLDHVGMIARQESVKLICEQIRKLVRDTNSVFILGGDMNSSSADPIFDPLIGEWKKVLNPDLTRNAETAMAKVGESQVPNHFPVAKSKSLMKPCRESAWETDNQITYNAYGKGKPAQIDHYFSSQNTDNLIYQTVRMNYGVPYISDHYPVTLIFTLK